jgi:mono/diheme cytochrome c family protein
MYKRLTAIGIGAVAVVALSLGQGKAGNVEKGKEVFESSACMGCHNTDTDEKRGNAPSLKGIFKRATLADGSTKVTDKSVLEKINKGGNGMPPYEEQLEKPQKDDLIAYLKSL